MTARAIERHPDAPNLPTRSRAILATAGKGTNGLELVDVRTPSPGRDEVLVRVRASSLNYLDLLAIDGRLDEPGSKPFVPVSDGAGVVVRVGTEVRSFGPGDRVVSVHIPGWESGRYERGHQELAGRPGLGTKSGHLVEHKLFRAQELLPLPDRLSFEEAATLPVAGVTAWNALARAKVRPGGRVLIHGTGGVSILSLQLALAQGLEPIITSSRDAKLARVSALGAPHTINYTDNPDWEDDVLSMTSGVGVDGVVETVGGDNLAKSLRVLRPGGHIALVGFLAGTTAPLDLVRLAMTEATISGLSVGSRQDFEELLRAISTLEIAPVIDRVFPLEQSAMAFDYLRSREHFGKVVISLRPSKSEQQGE